MMGHKGIDKNRLGFHFKYIYMLLTYFFQKQRTECIHSNELFNIINNIDIEEYIASIKTSLL